LSVKPVKAVKGASPVGDIYLILPRYLGIIPVAYNTFPSCIFIILSIVSG